MTRARNMIWLAVAIATALATCGCGGDTAPVPRRYAYPRIAVHAPEYVRADSVPVVLEVPASLPVRTERRADGSVWFTIDYPAYGAYVYGTLTPVDVTTVAGVVDNRVERAGLNIGPAPVSAIDVVSTGGYDGVVMVAPSAVSMPVHFLSYNLSDPRWVVSGSAFFKQPPTAEAADSVAPVVEVMVRDVTRMMQRLETK